MTKFHCPLCKSLLSETKYYQVLRVADAQFKAQQEIKKRLQEAQQQKKDIIARQKEAMRQLEKDKRLAIKDGIEKGKLKEKSRADRLSKLVHKQSEDLQHATRKIKELEKHLKDGTTPQTAGHDFEKDIVKQLQKEFPGDKIEHTGK